MTKHDVLNDITRLGRQNRVSKTPVPSDDIISIVYIAMLFHFGWFQENPQVIDAYEIAAAFTA